MAIIKKLDNSAGRDMEKLEPTYIPGGNEKWCILKNSLAVPPNVKHKAIT
jgi:hypothetical protein